MHKTKSSKKTKITKLTTSKEAESSCEKGTCSHSHNKGVGLSLFLIITAGLAAGAIGALLSAPYLASYSATSASLVNSYDWSRANSGVVIRDAKKVVVNQDVKINESAATVSASFVKFFPNLNSPIKNNPVASLERNDFYQLDQALATGVLLSDNGWVLALWPASDLNNLDLKKINASFDALGPDGKIYNIDTFLPVDNFIAEKIEKYQPVFIHLAAAANLPVRKLSETGDLTIGQTLFLSSGRSEAPLAFLAGRKKSALPRSSEDLSDRLILQTNGSFDSEGAFVFNLSGDLVAWKIGDADAVPVYLLKSRISSLFKNKVLVAPYLGVEYYDLSEVKIPGFNQSQGALLYGGKAGMIVKGSPAGQAGLREGDVITAVNGEKITAGYGLNLILQNYLPGDTILLSYVREKESLETSVKLGQQGSLVKK